MIKQVLEEIKFISKSINNPQTDISLLLISLPLGFTVFLRREILNNDSLYSRYIGIINEHLILLLKVLTLFLMSCIFLVTMLFFVGILIRIILHINSDADREKLNKTLIKYLPRFILASLLLGVAREIISYFS